MHPAPDWYVLRHREMPAGPAETRPAPLPPVWLAPVPSPTPVIEPRQRDLANGLEPAPRRAALPMRDRQSAAIKEAPAIFGLPDRAKPAFPGPNRLPASVPPGLHDLIATVYRLDALPHPTAHRAAGANELSDRAHFPARFPIWKHGCSETTTAFQASVRWEYHGACPTTLATWLHRRHSAILKAPPRHRQQHYAPIHLPTPTRQSTVRQQPACHCDRGNRSPQCASGHRHADRR